MDDVGAPQETLAPASEPRRPKTAPERNPVIDHLLFQKAMADHDPDQIDTYVQMAEEGVAGFPDPTDKAIALAFALVLEEHMDPWSIDLVRFSTLYAQRVHDEDEVDLITAGRLLAMAWTILLRQTEGLLERAQPPDPEPDAWDMPWDSVPASWGAAADDPDVQFTHRVLANREPPLSESVFHQGNRRVTLYELVEALEDARREAEVRIRLTEERAKARAEIKGQTQQNMKKIHKEDLEAEISDVRARLVRVRGEVTFAALHDGTREDWLTVFISCLFLSRANMVELRQEAFPVSPILVEPLPALHDRGAPLLGLPTKGALAKEGASIKEDANRDDDASGTNGGDRGDNDAERSAPEAGAS